MIEDRNRLKNRVHAILAKNGVIDYPNPFTKKGREFLDEIELQEIDRKILESYLSIIDRTKEIKRIDRIIVERAKQNDDTILLTTCRISYYSAPLIKSEIGDINRFPNKFKVISYAGLCPSIKQSGNKEIRGHITKQGSRMLRWILIQCANVAIRHDEYLRNFFI